MLKRVALATLATAVLAAGAGALFVRGRLQAASDVVSIATLPGYQDAALLARAWALPVARHYQNPPVSQTNPSACGPTSLANVLRSKGHPEATAELVHAQGCVAGYCVGGVSLSGLAAAAQASDPGAKVTVLRGLSLEQFRDELTHANDESRRYVINFHRGLLFGKGGGHHSPIGGYLADLDLVFVLDVNRSFGPWLVPTERLYRAMDSVDSSTGLERGLLRIE